MGFFDRVLNPQEEQDPRFSDFATAMIPLAGPFMARDKMKRRAEGDYRKNMDSIYKYVDEDPLSQRVAGRMLSRTGEESIPGIMAATEATRQARDPSNMGNFGNVLMNTSSVLQGKGVPGSANLAAAAHKNFQTPWKPDEGTQKPLAFKNSKTGERVATYDLSIAKQWVGSGEYIPMGVASGDDETPWTVMKGADLGDTSATAGDLYAVKNWDPQKRTAKEVKKLDNAANVSVGGASILSKPDLSAAVGDYTGAISSTQESVNTIDSLLDTLDANPGGGVSGLSGAVTNFVGSISNLVEFAKSADDEQVLAKYEKGLMGIARKYFPTGDEAQVRAQIIDLAYGIARANNMGTAGGGRGITDADMQYALKQLGSMSNVEDFKGVLNYQRSRMTRNLKLQRQAIEAKVKLAGGKVEDLAPLDEMYNAVSERKPKTGKGSAPREAEDEVRKNPALKQAFFDKFGYLPDGI